MIIRTILLTSFFLAAGAAWAQSDTTCPFDTAARSFVGSPVEQARCLLRPVGRYGQLGAPLERLPSPLDALVGSEVSITRKQLEAHIRRLGLSSDAIGGDLADRVSRANNDGESEPPARYFVIHDASTPNYKRELFPTDIDSASWRFNELKRWQSGNQAHVYINRLGQSTTSTRFSIPWRSTKLELRRLGRLSKGLFLHVELVQPRRSDSAGPEGNDALAPEPAFTDAQYERLALLYIVASVRSGRWLIPAYHATLDAGFHDAHDDPQGFDLEKWAAAVERMVRGIRDEG